MEERWKRQVIHSTTLLLPTSSPSPAPTPCSSINTRVDQTPLPTIRWNPMRTNSSWRRVVKWPKEVVGWRLKPINLNHRGSPDDGQTNFWLSKVNGVFIQIHSQDRMSSRCGKRLIRKGSERQGVTLNNSGGYWGAQAASQVTNQQRYGGVVEQDATLVSKIYCNR